MTKSKEYQARPSQYLMSCVCCYPFPPVCTAWQLHKKICSRSKCTPKIKPCTHILYGYMLNIGSPGVSYYIKRLGAPERIRCACHAPSLFLPCTHEILSSSAMLGRGPFPVVLDSSSTSPQLYTATMFVLERCEMPILYKNATKINWDKW